MTRDEFKRLPYLVMEHHVVAAGFGRATVSKFVDCGVLVRICPAGCGQARYQKKQLGQLLHWGDLLDNRDWNQEPALLSIKAVMRWTGWSDTTLSNMAAAGGLSFVKPAGSGKGKFLKSDVARLIGLDF